MVLNPETKRALEFARKTVPLGRQLDMKAAMAVAFHAAGLHTELPEVASRLPVPKSRRRDPDKVRVSPSLKRLLDSLENCACDIAPKDFLVECGRTPAGKRVLRRCGLGALLPDTLKRIFHATDPDLDRQGDNRVQPKCDGHFVLKILDMLSPGWQPLTDELQEQLSTLRSSLESTTSNQTEQSRCDLHDVLSDEYDLSTEHQLHNLGNKMYGAGKFAEASTCYSLALFVRPELLETFFNDALACTRMILYERGLRQMTKVIEMNPNLPEAFYTRGLIHEYRLEFEEAIKDYDQAIAVEEGYEKAWKQRDIAMRKMQEARNSGSDRDSEDRWHDAVRVAQDKEAKAIREQLEAFHSEARAEGRVPVWRDSPVRERTLAFLGNFGEIITSPNRPRQRMVGMERYVGSLCCNLIQKNGRSTAVIGMAGTGKTALVEELGRLIIERDPGIPDRLLDCDIFALSANDLHAGTLYRGEFEERIKHVINLLQLAPNIVLFVDEAHSFFQSSIHDDNNGFNRGVQAFKKPLADGRVTCIACTTLNEYRHFIQVDSALARRFNELRIDPPARETTLQIVEARKSGLEEHYSPMSIPAGLLSRAVDLTDEYLPAHQQPCKSIQLLDSACAAARRSCSGEVELREEHLLEALESRAGKGIRRTTPLTLEQVLGALQRRIVGHEEVLQGLARAVVAGLGGWKKRKGPRGVFLLAGPTGVGKTETALAVGDALGLENDAVIRIDCNTLQGAGHSSDIIVHRLLGVPPGLVGYVRGEGGILSTIRDKPECVVLFDELEKADPAVGRLVLQIIDNGKVEDTEGNVLDFRRAFIVMTTNAGAQYDPDRRLGFSGNPAAGETQPRITESDLKKALRSLALAEEFIGRISHIFLFQGLDRTAISQILGRQLEELQTMARERSIRLTHDSGVVERLASRWEQRYSVRNIKTLLYNTVIEQLNLAEAQGELDGVNRIRLSTAGPVGENRAGDLASRARFGNRLIVYL